MGRARRRGRRRAPRRSPARVRTPPPALRPPLPAPPARRSPKRSSSPRRTSPVRARGCASSKSSTRPSPSSSTARPRASRAGCRSSHPPIRRRAGRPPKRSPRGSRPGCARVRTCSTRCSPTRTSTTGCASSRAGSRAATSSNEASDESVAALVEAVQGRYSIPQRWYRLKAKLLGVERMHDYDRMASIASSEAEFGFNEARELVLDSYASFSPDLASIAEQLLRRAVDRRAGASGQAVGCVLRVHRAHAPPLRVAQLDLASARRADPCARARSRDPRVPRTSAGRVPPGDTAHVGRDRVGVRRDGHVRDGCCRRRPNRTSGSRCSPRTSRVRSRPSSARSR